MVKISKSEMLYLKSKGYKFGDAIYKTHTSHPTYYCNEGKALGVIKKYRESSIVYSRP